MSSFHKFSSLGEGSKFLGEGKQGEGEGSSFMGGGEGKSMVLSGVGGSAQVNSVMVSGVGADTKVAGSEEFTAPEGYAGCKGSEVSESARIASEDVPVVRPFAERPPLLGSPSSRFVPPPVSGVESVLFVNGERHVFTGGNYVPDAGTGSPTHRRAPAGSTKAPLVAHSTQVRSQYHDGGQIPTFFPNSALFSLNSALFFPNSALFFLNPAFSFLSELIPSPTQTSS